MKGITLDRVNFRYPTGDRTVLEDINLEILPGQMVALVGENGSGKTTLIKLLCRLYDPVSGNIAIDGIDLRQFDPVAIRREVSVILQNYARYCLTARENIWLGDISLPAHDDKILHAARQTRADDFIQKLPGATKPFWVMSLRTRENSARGSGKKWLCPGPFCARPN